MCNAKTCSICPLCSKDANDTRNISLPPKKKKAAEFAPTPVINKSDLRHSLDMPTNASSWTVLVHSPFPPQTHLIGNPHPEQVTMKIPLGAPFSSKSRRLQKGWVCRCTDMAGLENAATKVTPAATGN
uniref:Uncharacterized protein n=1 Tax=Eutreptiella gymnastica TaxID=73025 RepID=A0A7S1IUX7_9EUGL